MSRFTALALLCAAPVAATLAPVPAAAATDEQVLRDVAGHLRAIQTMKADFVQTDRSGQSVSGTLTLKRPGKIRFEYEKSYPVLIVADGRSLTMVDYDVRQVQRWPIGDSPLGALLDPNRDVTRFGRVIPSNDPNVVSVEVRDRKHPEYGIITLILTRGGSGPGGLTLEGWVAVDSQNKRTSIRLNNHRYGVPVAESAFTYRDPRGSQRGPRR